jgi:putative transposase
MKPPKGSHYLRKGRASLEGHYYLLTATAHEKQRIFEQPGAAQIVLDTLFWLEREKIIDLEAAVVMPDHVHCIARLRTGTLSGLMHSLKSFTSNKIRLLLKFQGKVWQSQYHDHGIRKDEVLEEVVLYCLNNPVRAGLVEDFHEYPYWYCRYEV